MEQRQLIAYGLILAILLLFAVVFLIAGRDWRGRRRAARQFDRQQRRRRADGLKDRAGP